MRLLLEVLRKTNRIFLFYEYVNVNLNVITFNEGSKTSQRSAISDNITQTNQL